MAEKHGEEEKKELQLLFSWLSPFSQRVELALALKGLDYEKLPQDVGEKSPLLLASNPVYKKIPVLLHGGRAICESAIILQYLDEAFPDTHQLLPLDCYRRATARFWADFVDRKLLDVLTQVLRSEGDAQKAALESVIGSLATLDEELGKMSASEASPFFGGEKMGFVDIMFAPLSCCYPAIEAAGGFKFRFQEKYPHLHALLAAFNGSSIAALLPEPERVTELVMNRRRGEAAAHHPQ